MAWNTVHTWAAYETVTAANMNNNDANLTWLYDNYAPPSPVVTNMLTRAPDSVGQGTWVVLVFSSAPYNAIFYNSSNADGDNFTVKFRLPKGTYTLRFNSVKRSNRGMVQGELDGVDLGTTDLYSASDDYTNVVEITSVSVSTSGEHDLKFSVNGKNASSSAYTIDFNQIEFIRTA